MGRNRMAAKGRSASHKAAAEWLPMHADLRVGNTRTRAEELHPLQMLLQETVEIQKRC